MSVRILNKHRCAEGRTVPLVAAAAETTGPRRDGASVLAVVVVGVPNGPMASRRFFLKGGNPRPACFVIQGGMAI